MADKIHQIMTELQTMASDDINTNKIYPSLRFLKNLVLHVMAIFHRGRSRGFNSIITVKEEFEFRHNNTDGTIWM